MKINSDLKLVLRDVYLYDIEACHYNIMKKLGTDMTDIDADDKIGRNIKIGQMMQKNPRLTSLLRNTTKSIIDEYISKNNVKDDQIILRQYDGILLTRTLRETNLQQTPLDLRKTFQIFISSIERNKYIALDNSNKVIIKGVSFRYPEIDKIYDQVCRTVDLNRESMFKRLQRIKDNFMNSENARLFAIPSKNNKFNIYLKRFGEMEVSAQTLKIMDTQDVDKDRYFKFYIQPFTKSIVVEFVRGR
jgi:hypothetical protein